MNTVENTVIKNESANKRIETVSNIPYMLFANEAGSNAAAVISELKQISEYYTTYWSGVQFSNGSDVKDYVPSHLRYKMVSSLINKEARFLFAETPDMAIKAKYDSDELTQNSIDAIAKLNIMLGEVLDTNNFEDALLKAAKDCFIGKRVAALVNFNIEDGITLTFLPSTNFYYEFKNNTPNILSKFVSFTVLKDSLQYDDKIILVKKYELIDGIVYLSELEYNGMGTLVNDKISGQRIRLKQIPAVIILNDGLTAEKGGESEIMLLQEHEQYYSIMGNADMDAEKKGMNTIKFLKDISSGSAQDLSTAPGSLWHVDTDQNLDSASSEIGQLEPSLSYSDALKTTMDRIKTSAYELIDMPNITLETLQGAITSGKSLKAIYWSLLTRCKEKMKVWGPALKRIIRIIVDGAYLYPDILKGYVNNTPIPVIYKPHVEWNSPILDDETEEKATDLAEVAAEVKSRKAYLMKWCGMTSKKADEELIQIAYEKQLLENGAYDFGGKNNNAKAVDTYEV